MNLMNKKMILSEEGKLILDDITEQLDMERPIVIQIALAKGIQNSDKLQSFVYDKGSNKWTIPDNIINEENFLLFKYLIQNEEGRSLDNIELHEYLIEYIELGLRQLDQISKEKTSLEDLRITILN